MPLGPLYDSSHTYYICMPRYRLSFSTVYSCGYCQLCFSSISCQHKYNVSHIPLASMSQQRSQRPSAYQQNRPFAGVDNLLQRSDGFGTGLSVFGISATLHADDQTASYYEEGKHLLPWFGQEDIMVDRYDVRLLVDDPHSFDRLTPNTYKGASSIPDDVDEGELQYERYQDLDYSQEHLLTNPYHLWEVGHTNGRCWRACTSVLLSMVVAVLRLNHDRVFLKVPDCSHWSILEA